MPELNPDRRLYEAMFLLSQNALAEGLENGEKLIRGLIEAVDGEVDVLRKWDERKLSYPIESQKRGTYLITYFHVNPRKIVEIERQCNLTEDVLRVMFTRCDHVGDEEMQAIRDGKDVNPGVPEPEVTEEDGATTTDDGAPAESLNEGVASVETVTPGSVADR